MMMICYHGLKIIIILLLYSYKYSKILSVIRYIHVDIIIIHDICIFLRHSLRERGDRGMSGEIGLKPWADGQRECFRSSDALLLVLK